MTLTVAIVTRNRSRLLKKALEALKNQQVYPEEVVIIDNASVDNTRQIVENFGKLPIKYFYEAKIGIPYARNKALKLARGDVLAFMDDDSLPPRDWLKKVKSTHSKYQNIAAVQGKSVALNPESIMSILFQTNYDYWIWKNIYREKNLAVGDTNNLSLKLGIIRAKNIRFDTNLARGSDVDFAKNLIKKGEYILYEPKIEMFHHMRSGWIAFFYQRWKMGKAQALLQNKWPDENEDKGFSKDYYKQSIQSMLNKKKGLSKFLLHLAFKIYHPLFWIAFFLSNPPKKTSPKYEKFRIDKKILPVSVAIITKDRSDLLEQCLKSLLKQAVLPKEVVIIDNNSGDGTKNVCYQYSQLLPIHYYVEKKIGTSFARNMAVKMAKNPIIAFIDDDCQAAPDWVEQVYSAHLKYPDVAAVQGRCRVIPYKGTLSYIYEVGYRKWLSSLIVGKKLLTLDTANASFKKNILQNKNIRFDTTFVKYCDDEDLCQQLLYKGEKVIYWPKALVGARRRQSRIEYFKERYRKGVAKATFDKKWKRVILSRVMYLKGRKIDLNGLYNYKNIRLRKLLLEPTREETENFFNRNELNWLIKIKIYIVMFLFEYMYHTGYLLTQFRQRFRELDTITTNKNIKIATPLTLAVMIITKNRYDQLTNTLNSLVIQSKDINEVLIIDSSSNVNKALIDRFSKILTINHITEPPSGFGVARNTALYACKSDIIATIDDDAIADTSWAKKILKAHKKNNAVAIQGRIICSPISSAIAKVEQIRLDKWLLGNMNYQGGLTTLSTKNVSFKVKELIKNGIKFEENPLFGKYGSEDLDIANKILTKDKSIAYDSDIKIYHQERQNIIAYIKQQVRKGYSNAVLDRVWNSVIKKKTYYLSLDKRVEPLFLINSHPYIQSGLFTKLIYLLVYYVSAYAFTYGKKTMDLRLKKDKNESLWKQSKMLGQNEDIGIIVKSNNHINLRRIIDAFSKQTVRPEIIFVVTRGKIIPHSLIQLHKMYFTIHELSQEALESKIRNRKIKNTYLAVISEEVEINNNWVESIITSHKSHSGQDIVQGRRVFYPENNPRNILARFNYQSMIRATMQGDKKLYWKWFAGQTERNFKVKFLDRGNISIKTRIFKKHRVSEVFGGEILPLLDPKIVVYEKNKSQNFDFNNNNWIIKIPHKQSGGFKKIASLINFCLRNQYFYFLPSIVIISFSYQINKFLLTFNQTDKKRLIQSQGIILFD